MDNISPRQGREGNLVPLTSQERSTNTISYRSNVIIKHRKVICTAAKRKKILGEIEQLAIKKKDACCLKENTPSASLGKSLSQNRMLHRIPLSREKRKADCDPQYFKDRNKKKTVYSWIPKEKEQLTSLF